MEIMGDEGRALKVARALSYIDFFDLPGWLGKFGFIKIFYGLREEGSDLGWALLLGVIERALAGDCRLTRDVIDSIVRENRVTVKHLCELYPDGHPVTCLSGAYTARGVDILSEDAASSIRQAVRAFNEGTLTPEGLLEELYRTHTSEMRHSLYYHALLSAKTVNHPVSTHMLWKALRLFPGEKSGNCDIVQAQNRLEKYQTEKPGLAMGFDPKSRSAVLDAFSSVSDHGPPAAAGPPPDNPADAGDYRAKAREFLKIRGVQEHRRARGLGDILGYDESRLNQLLEPFLLRTYSSDGELDGDGGLILALGPAEVDKVSFLQSIARALGLPCTVAASSDFSSGWAGETENALLKTLTDARELSARTGGRPAVVIVTEDGQSDVLSVLSGILAGPRNRELSGGGDKGSVIIVAAVSQAISVGPVLRRRANIIRLDLPDQKGLERLLIQNTVGRYFRCNLEQMDFCGLAAGAAGLSPGVLERVARRAKLSALNRRARELGTRLTSAPDRLRAKIRDGYCITQEDLTAVLAEEQLVRLGRGNETAQQGPTSGASEMDRGRPARRQGLAAGGQPTLKWWADECGRACAKSGEHFPSITKNGTGVS